MKNLLFVFSLFILVSAFDDNTLGEAKKKVVEGIENLPDSVKDALPKGINPEEIMEKVPSVEEGEELLKERCMKYGTNESFNEAMVAKEEIQFCLRGLVNYTQVQKEIEKAKPTGDLDNVFRKYCRKSPDLRNCVTNFTTSIEPCLRPEERDMKMTISNITDALIGFICFKEGDRIALFIAEGGPECLKNNTNQIQDCINSTFSQYIPKDVEEKTADDLVLFKLGESECQDLTKLQQCVVGHLQKCSEPTPANIIDSMFTFVRKTTPCHKFDVSAATTSVINTLALIATLTLAIAVNHL